MRQAIGEGVEVELSEEQLRAATRWSERYRSEWDSTPDKYADEGVVAWGRSRRLGLFEVGKYKAYIGVQHIDPTRPGWGIVDEPLARFFVSMFVGRRCVALRTFPTMGETLDALRGFLQGSMSGR